jgi:hypothetical protein
MKSEDIQQALLDDNDFGHELHVGQALSSFPPTRHGKPSICFVEHGGTYIDRVSEKPRQFDYRCGIENREDNARLVMALECKNLWSKNPLVVCGRARTESGSIPRLC